MTASVMTATKYTSTSSHAFVDDTNVVSDVNLSDLVIPHIEQAMTENQDNDLLQSDDLPHGEDATDPAQYYDEDCELTYRKAVRGNGMFLRHVESMYQSSQLVCAALRQNPRAVQFVDELNNPPKDECESYLKTKDRYHMLVIKNDGMNLQYLKNPSETVIRAAIVRTVDCIQFLDTLSQHLQRFAVGQNPHALKHILRFNPSDDVINSAIAKNGHVVQYLSSPTPYQRLLAVKGRGRSLRHLQNPTVDECTVAVMENHRSSRYVPRCMRTGEFWTNVKQQKFTYAARLAAVSRDGMQLQHIPEDAQTVELCVAAMKQNPEAIRFSKYQFRKFAVRAVEQNGLMIQHINKRDHVICYKAVKENREAFKFLTAQDTSYGLLYSFVLLYPDMVKLLNE